MSNAITDKHQLIKALRRLCQNMEDHMQGHQTMDPSDWILVGELAEWYRQRKRQKTGQHYSLHNGQVEIVGVARSKPGILEIKVQDESRVWINLNGKCIIRMHKNDT